jgi:hypothetical protein
VYAGKYKRFTHINNPPRTPPPPPPSSLSLSLLIIPFQQVFKRLGKPVTALSPANFSDATRTETDVQTRCAREINLGHADVCVGEFVETAALRKLTPFSLRYSKMCGSLLLLNRSPSRSLLTRMCASASPQIPLSLSLCRAPPAPKTSRPRVTITSHPLPGNKKDNNEILMRERESHTHIYIQGSCGFSSCTRLFQPGASMGSSSEG